MVNRSAFTFILGVTALVTTLSAEADKPVLATRHANLEYARVGEKSLLLDIYIPDEATEPLPLVIWLHAGGWSDGDKGGPDTPTSEPMTTTVEVGEFEMMGKPPGGPAPVWLVRYGFAFASINYRLIDEAIFPAQIEDCKAAVRWLRAHAAEYGYDPDRIGVFGGSAGGHLAAHVGTSGDVKEFDVGAHLDVSSRVQTVCDAAGPTDLRITFTHEGKSVVVLRDLYEKLIGGPLEDDARAARVNPITFINGDEPPFLIVHGDQDILVQPENSRRLHAALRKAGVDSTLHIVEGAGHANFGREAEDRIGRFFRKHLRAPVKARGAGAVALDDALGEKPDPRSTLSVAQLMFGDPPTAYSLTADEILAGADARIERHRKGDVTVRVLDSAGRRVPGVAVKVSQTRHRFLFGSMIPIVSARTSIPPESDWWKRFANLFNAATVFHSWFWIEPEEGKAQWQDLDRAVEWCEENDIVAMGHAFHSGGWGYMPDWVLEGERSVDEIKALARGYADEVLRRYRGRVDAWIVVNEPLYPHGPKRLGASTVPVPPALAKDWFRDGAVETVKTAYDWAHEADPDAELVLNDFNPTGPSYHGLIESLLQTGAHIDGIGIQSHMFWANWDLASVWFLCERYARFGKPLTFSEITVLSNPFVARGQNAWTTRRNPSTPEGELRQADYCEKLYRVLFSHPAGIRFPIRGL